MPHQSFFDFGYVRPPRLAPAFYALSLVAVATLAMAVVIQLTDIRHVTIGYVIPVLIAALRWGIAESILAAAAAIAASAFFFYPPIFSLAVHDPVQIVELIMFVFVAVVTGHLASRLRIEADRVNRREIEIGDLYSFSRRLASANSAADIYAAIREHLESLFGRRVMLFSPTEGSIAIAHRTDNADLPEAIGHAVTSVSNATMDPSAGTIIDDGQKSSWLVRALSAKAIDFGIIAIGLGPRGSFDEVQARSRIAAVLADASWTLEHLDIASALSEARMRTETEKLRDALLGSVSHELRTPLASILGATTVLCDSALVKSEPRLSGLANVAREEAERLNNDIQNLLDATRISSGGVQAKLEWSEPADIVNAAIERRRNRLSNRHVNVALDDDMPLVLVDSVLVEQALGQILDNAGKYSGADTAIDIESRCDNGHIVMSVADQGAGFTEDERTHASQRFFRSPRNAATSTGAGLGLWIANAFVSANGGTLDIISGGESRGSTITIRLPLQPEQPVERHP